MSIRGEPQAETLNKCLFVPVSQLKGSNRIYRKSVRPLFRASYGHHALGKKDPQLTSHANYIGLHADRSARLKAYRALFSDTLSEALLTRLRENTNACTVIGNDRFKEQIATMLGRAVPTGTRGRPKKPA